MIVYKVNILRFFAICLSLFFFTGPASAIDESDKPAIEKIIREYLLQNPEILREMQQAYEIKQKSEQQARQKKTLAEKSDLIFSSQHQMEIGNPDAKIKIVEFFDYNCPFCQRAMRDMETILAANPDVKFIIKEWPVLGEQSFEAHNVSLAFNKLMPEKYAEFHQKLLAQKGRKGAAESIALATTFGVDEATIRAEMEKPYILEALQENNTLANDLGITGTPSYVIGEEVVFGAVGVEQLTARIRALQE